MPDHPARPETSWSEVFDLVRLATGLRMSTAAGRLQDRGHRRAATAVSEAAPPVVYGRRTAQFKAERDRISGLLPGGPTTGA